MWAARLRAKSGNCRMQIQIHNSSHPRQHHPMEPLPNGRSAAAPCGVQFVNVVCCMPRLATMFHFAFDTRESVNLLVKFVCLTKSKNLKIFFYLFFDTILRCIIFLAKNKNILFIINDLCIKVSSMLISFPGYILMILKISKTSFQLIKRISLSTN